MWTATDNTDNAQLKGIYNVAGEEVARQEGAWLTYAIYLDEVNFPVNGGIGGNGYGAYHFAVSFSHNIGFADFYVSDAAFVTAEQFNAFYGN